MINEYLELLSVSQEGIQIYITLIERGPLSVSALSKLSGVERTKLYRIADELITEGIIGEVLDYKKGCLKLQNHMKYIAWLSRSFRPDARAQFLNLFR